MMNGGVTVWQSQVHDVFPAANEIPVYDFHMERIEKDQIESLKYRKLLVNPAFIAPCWTLDQLAQTLKQEEEKKRKDEEDQIRRELEARKARDEAQAKKREAQKEKERERALNIVLQKDAKQEADRLRKIEAMRFEKEEAMKKKHEEERRLKNEKDRAKAKGREWDDHTHAPQEKGKAHKDELILMSKWPEKQFNLFFDAHHVDTQRHTRYLSALQPMMTTSNANTKWLTLSDGRFGMVAHHILSQLQHSNADVVASEVIPDTLLVAKEKGKINKYMTLSPVRLSLDDSSIDYLVSLEAFAHYESPMKVVSEMLRVSRMGAILLEPQDTPLDERSVGGIFIPDTLKAQLIPLAGGRSGVGDGDRLDLLQLIRTLRTQSSLRSERYRLFVKVFREAQDVELAKRQNAVGARPFSMTAAAIFKVDPSNQLIEEMKNSGFIEVRLEKSKD